MKIKKKSKKQREKEYEMWTKISKLAAAEAGRPIVGRK